MDEPPTWPGRKLPNENSLAVLVPSNSRRPLECNAWLFVMSNYSAALLTGISAAIGQRSEVVRTACLVSKSNIWYSPGQKERSSSTRDLAMLSSGAPSSQQIAF